MLGTGIMDRRDSVRIAQLTVTFGRSDSQLRSVYLGSTKLLAGIQRRDGEVVKTDPHTALAKRFNQQPDIALAQGGV